MNFQGPDKVLRSSVLYFDSAHTAFGESFVWTSCEVFIVTGSWPWYCSGLYCCCRTHHHHRWPYACEMGGRERGNDGNGKQRSVISPSLSRTSQSRLVSPISGASFQVSHLALQCTFKTGMKFEVMEITLHFAEHAGIFSSWVELWTFRNGDFPVSSARQQWLNNLQCIYNMLY